MSEALSPNTKAILLLTAPLIAGRGKQSIDLLSPTEYQRLALRLRELGGQPADLLVPGANQFLDACDRIIEQARLKRLLARGFLLSQAVERWQARAIWVVSRADPAYPQRLKVRLKEDSPALLYGCGEKTILGSGGLAVVGSRNADEGLIEYTLRIGRLAASAHQTVVSGGARGIDQAAMRGALDAGGRVVGVLADGLENTAMNREHRQFLQEQQLVLISPYDPNAGFNVGHAMQRNKVIYALADAALVVNADLNKGGTWAGAIEQLTKLRLVPLYVRSTDEASNGLDALRRMGAERWPNPEDRDGLGAALAPPVSSLSILPDQNELSFASQPTDTKASSQHEANIPATTTTAMRERPGDDPEFEAAEELFRTVRGLVLRIVREPKKAAEVALALGVTERQAEQWLKRLSEEGVLAKDKKPIRYSICQTSLFRGEVLRETAATTKRRGSGE
jgi:DNA processing protein